MRQGQGKRPTAVDIYCGVGGLSLGLIEAGFDLIGAIGNDETVLEAYRTNFPGVATARHDLNVITGSELRRVLGIAGRCVDLLVGGPPCQGFSVGGKGATSDPRNEGVLSFARI